MQAQLRGDHAIVEDTREANRVHNRGQYGAPQRGGALRLDLVEAAFLAESGRLEVARDGHALAWPDVLAHATRVRPGFAVHFLGYRDLRTRGYVLRPAPPREAGQGCHFLQWDRGAERARAPSGWLRVVSERATFGRQPLHALARAAQAHGARARLAVVDEESDVTHYELDMTPPEGETPPGSIEVVQGVLLEDRVHVADAGDAKRLHGREFFGHRVGDGLHLSLVEAMHLADRGSLAVADAATGRPVSPAALRRRGRGLEPQLEDRMRVYADLKGRGLVVKTGFKFGTHFRAYRAGPGQAHAPYLVQAVPGRFESPWEPVARAVRLSHSVRKRLYLAAPTGAGVEYLAFDRFRP